MPNYPYHLISDSEMCDAFIYNDLNYFDDNYPVLDESIRDDYDQLKEAICYHINLVKDSISRTIAPDWVYSYMLGQVISVNSDSLDRHDLLVSLDLDNTDDVFTSSASKRCLEISQSWIRKLNPSKRIHRPPTMFGEPHVIKSIRIDSTNLLGG